ncbi:MAG: glycosyl-4,4'-diaponeurosporenoate acyltransferase [Elusimicrobia bacterium]|jgi:glycosyl-4,4'-diaponeurosporenoate acyltransferase|nr:glycosyl-4,4'-diaponeurosporenoate acyltransferase [Elusimicrobiota bacterium]
MRILALPTLWTVLLDIVAWGAIHMGVSYLITQVPRARFDPRRFPFRPFFGETFVIYERVFRVKSWKSLVPDAAPWFPSGFAKRSLADRSPDYLFAFSQETCRGEVAHWVTMGFAPLFFLWNPAWVGGFMVFYAVVANLPCILIQRYNRNRIGRLVK